ncbi:MAG TPA: pilus (MSHA type) biogenesis protein MshL [Syntrophorhabdaceae bacterium]|nr:pilus (MSHA type) biogenesis protein MshL [Syntrophorhabdaceae bacterium]HQM82435.1 pilus (MSHA type) biogenesis protein MshL [Syntrophorhabdaceae bacterium]
MGNNKIIKIGIVVCLCMCCALLGCGQTRPGIKREVKIPEELKQTRVERPSPTPPRTPEFIPVSEDLSPLRTRIVDIAARKTPLRDVLHVIAEATSLNLVMERGVDPETEVNLTLRNVTAENALDTIFAAVDYFYKVQENLLIVKAVDTKMFELGHPAMTQTYGVDVGGDIFGGAMNITPTGSGSGGGGGGGSSSTSIKGSVTQKVQSDETAFKFWDSIEKSIENILGTQAAAAGAGGATAGVRQSYTINRLTGMIYVTASKKNLQKVEDYIRSVKRTINRQVMIEARVIEVALSDIFQLGIDWTLVDRFMTSAGRTTSSFTFGTTRFNTVVPNTGPVFTIAGIPSFGGQEGDLNFTMRALEEQGEVRTLSNPKLNIMNGQTALLTVGRNEAYISKVETTTTAGAATVTTFTVETNSVLSGILIGILPYINESGEISLTVTPIVSDLVRFTTKNVGTPTVVELSLPTVDLRQLSTTVKVRHGDVIVIGGLIQQKESLTDDQVPFLGNIPLLGYLFKSRNKLERKVELVIVLQPVLVNM